MKDILKLKQGLIEKEYNFLNDMQKEAVFNIDGPLLILAGAGSGKTTVIVNRIAYMIKYGNAYYDTSRVFTDDEIEYLENSKDQQSVSDILATNCVSPYNILAITFTNKAAKELKERIEKKVGAEGEQIWASTFHSACVRILRKDINLLGFKNDFTIYDTDDSIKVIKQCLKTLNIDEKYLPPKKILAAISNAKNALVAPDDYMAKIANDYNGELISKVYQLYQTSLRTANALDFDDLIYFTVELLDTNPQVRQYYHRRFKYVLIDEYQDTNNMQYKLVSLLVGEQNNICVVGDDDQSIYKFRGATIENILQFENQYKNAQVIRLEQNYRSTSYILDVANAVIKNNQQRKGKKLWTAKEGGDKVVVNTLATGDMEARYIRTTIETEMIKNNYDYSDFAVLYRTNAQSRAIEAALRFAGIPCVIFGGVGFFDRKEIKDMLAYMSVVSNMDDSLRMRRIINEPKRKIGKETVDKVQAIADSIGVSFFEILKNCHEYPELARSQTKLKEFAYLIMDLKDMSQRLSLKDFYTEMIYKTGYVQALIEEDTDESKDRKRNIEELATAITQYQNDDENANLEGFLEQTALLADIDNYEEDRKAVSLMTVHSAKGLEFPCVFIAGMEEGLFPSQQSMFEKDGMEEERRLCYVAVTRARERLYITNAHERMVYGQTSYTRPSCFIDEMPKELLSMVDRFPQKKQNIPAYNDKKPNLVGSAKIPGATKADAAKYTVGMIVEHKVFGVGQIISAKPMGSDAMLEIAFDSVGNKKVMANYANLIIK